MNFSHIWHWKGNHLSRVLKLKTVPHKHKKDVKKLEICCGRPVHINHYNDKNNDKDIVLKSFSILKNSRVHSTDTQRNYIVGITFRAIYLICWRIQILTANQNQSCHYELENLKRQTSMCLQMISFAGVDANIIIFKVVVGRYRR